MKSEIIILATVLVTLSIIFSFIYFFPPSPFYFNQKNSNQLPYQGPVPEGYDEEYFRETGITKPLEDKDGS